MSDLVVIPDWVAALVGRLTLENEHLRLYVAAREAEAGTIESGEMVPEAKA